MKKSSVVTAFLVCSFGVGVVGFFTGYRRGYEEGVMEKEIADFPVGFHNAVQMYKMRKMLEQPATNRHGRVPGTVDVRALITSYYEREYLPYKDDYEKGRWTAEDDPRLPEYMHTIHFVDDPKFPGRVHDVSFASIANIMLTNILEMVREK